MENQMSMATVMVVQAPGRAEADLRALRDYILESLNQGVLVLGAGMSYQLEKFPELGAVRITSVDILRGNKELLRRAAPTGTGSGRLKKSEEEIRAAQSQEKKAILARLQEYRQANGMGCFKALAQKTGKLSAETLLSVVTGNQVLPIEDWRKIGRALDKMGAAHG